MIKYNLLFSCLITVLSCKTPPVSPHSYKHEIISFGSGGGFSGAYSEYFLMDNGKILSLSEDKKQYLEVKQIKSNLSSQIFNNIKTFGLDTLSYVHPQNMYYFLKFKNGTDSNYVSWSGKPVGKISAAASIYKLLNSQLKSIDK